MYLPRRTQIAGIKGIKLYFQLLPLGIIFGISSVRSRKENSGYWVWLDNTAVGNGHTWKPIDERMGMTTVRDTRPTPDKSWTATTFFTLFAYILSILLFFLHLPHENRLHHFGNSFFGTRHHRHLPAVAAHHAFPAAHGSTLLQRLTQTVPMAAEHKCLGPYIRSFRENKAIPLRAKIISLLLMWGTMVYCIFFLIPLTEIKIVLFLVAVGVTWHILSFKTLK